MVTAFVEFRRVYTEPALITAIPVSGVAQIASMEGDQVCISWYLDLPPISDGRHELRIVERMVMPRSAIPALQVMLAQATTLEAVQQGRGTPIGH